MAAMVRDDLRLNLVADCRSVSEGVAACLREKPDVVVVDWMLPDGRGFDLVRRVGPELPRTRWLCVSATANPLTSIFSQRPRSNRCSSMSRCGSATIFCKPPRTR
jgi:DNA-binding NarL/FixJ family response regulator